MLKDKHGDTDWTKILMAFGAMAVLILQQFQSYRIAEIKAQGEVNAVQFMKRAEIVRRLDHMDEAFMRKDELLHHLKMLEDSHGIK